MFKLSVLAICCFIINVFDDGAVCFSFEFRQLNAHLSFGPATEDYSRFQFFAYLFKGWRKGCIPITKDLFDIRLGCKA